MSACEVITWIAFRRAIPHDDLGRLFKVTPVRWYCVPAETVLEALEARAGLSGDGRFCAIRQAAIAPDLDRYPSRHTIFTSEGPRALRWIRAQHRRETGRLLSFAELARLLREEIAFDEEVSAQIEEGKARLRDRAAAGLLTAYGIPLRADGSRAAGALPEPLPATLFMHPAITLAEWDTLDAHSNSPATQWRDQQLPRFEEIQFKTAEVLRLWPPHIGPRETSEWKRTNSCTVTDAIGRIAYGTEYRWPLFRPAGRYLDGGRETTPAGTRSALPVGFRAARNLRRHWTESRRMGDCARSLEADRQKAVVRGGNCPVNRITVRHHQGIRRNGGRRARRVLACEQLAESTRPSFSIASRGPPHCRACSARNGRTGLSG